MSVSRDLANAARDYVDNCYACNGGVTFEEHWPERRCPICGDLRAALEAFEAVYGEGEPRVSANREEILELDRRLALPGQDRLVGTYGTTYVGQVLEDIVAPPGFSFVATIEPTPVALERIAPESDAGRPVR